METLSDKYIYLNVVVHNTGIYFEYYIQNSNNRITQTYLFNYDEINGYFEYSTNTYLVGSYINYNPESPIVPKSNLNNFSLPEFQYLIVDK